MKAFLLVCLTVAAYADPQLILNSPYAAGYVQSPLGYAKLPFAYAQQPLTYVQTQPIVKIQEEQKPVEEKKVEVEAYSAEQEKKIETPLVYTSNIFGQPIVYANQPIIQNLKVVPRYQAKNGDVEHTVYKREADAEAQFPFGYNAMPYNAMPYASTYGYGLPLVRSAPVVAASPVVYKTQVVDPLANVGAKTYANNFHPLSRNYAGKGQYVADSVGARHIAKREADPALVYAAANPWGYSPLSTVYNSWAAPKYYNAVPAVPLTGQTVADSRFQTAQAYGGRNQYVANSGGAIHIAKRDAEADPALVYANSNLGYTYGSPLAYNYGSPLAYNYGSNVAYRPYSTWASTPYFG